MLTTNNKEKEIVKALLATKYEINLIGIELSNKKNRFYGKKNVT